MTIADNIKKLREQYGLTQAELGEIAGVSDKAVSTWENGTAEPRMGAVQKIAEHFNVTKGSIIDDKPDANITPTTITNSGRIKVYGRVAAGIPVEANEDIRGEIDVPAQWVDDHVALIVEGDSMFPKYQDGDTVIFRQQPTCDSGQDCVVYVNGYDATLKTVYLKDGGILLQPINPAYDPMFYGPDDEPVIIAGVIVELRRKV